jgi:hypothetical protein
MPALDISLDASLEACGRRLFAARRPRQEARRGLARGAMSVEVPNGKGVGVFGWRGL